MPELKKCRASCQKLRNHPFWVVLKNAKTLIINQNNSQNDLYK